MIHAHYKYTKKDAEDFILSHIKEDRFNDSINLTVEVIPDNISSPIPNVPQYSFHYPCPIRVLEILMGNDGLIPAIKELRAITGWGLKESKDYIEYIINHYTIGPLTRELLLE